MSDPFFPAARRAQRIEAATLRASKRRDLDEALDYYTRCDRAHARTDREDDYLELLRAEHTLAKRYEAFTGACMGSHREEIEGLARSECGFDIIEERYMNDDGDLVLGGEKPAPTNGDHCYDDMRDERDDAAARAAGSYEPGRAGL